ncbi:hypothetical protein CFC21_023842 [Triticum aestivum]|uniref:PB1 domain-containing protein n=2 Tax=Triticum aestivum TaxID=4565 RepID=A0A9R1EFT4_WHEAT|nr:uncharacterized protein LOC123041420 [Triticum aestivum]KAF7009286.1 hypothetical protein CFC21_023841 [Triticum aestivum]KAF7009287.1 hypothetical protein CFC21_023842 [Triticum aestivum]
MATDQHRRAPSMAAGQQRRVKLIVSYGGRIERAEGRPPRYVGGEHLLLNVLSSVSTRGFRDLLAARAGFSNFSVKYCYSGEGLDSLCDVDTDEDLRDMLDILLYRDLQARLFNDQNTRRFRVYLFRDAAAPSPTSQALGKPAPMRRSATSPALLSAKTADVGGRPSHGLAAPTPSLVARITTSPNLLCETSTVGTAPSKPPLAPTLARRIASSTLLTADSTDDTASLITTTSTSAARATQHTPPHAAAFWPAEQRNPVYQAAPVFLVPVMPQVIIHRPEIILVPMFNSKVAMG